jgi:EAL domain-containing protein (putative c-di-GMP-specific phosphodiesterase class I)
MQGLGMNINVAPPQLARPDFASMVDATLDASEISPVSLTLELAPGSADYLDATLELRDLGVNLAIEDFGQGTTLEDVRRLPVNALKLHASFVMLAAGPPEDVAFAESLLAIARARNLTTTGKGVETRDQARRLASLGCDLAQGFLYSKPLGPEGIGTLLARGRVSFAGAPRPIR